MEFIDIILGGFLAYGLVRGIWKGLFAELASVISLLTGIFIAVKFSALLGNALQGVVDNPKHAKALAFILLFAAVVIGLMLVAKTFTKLADWAGLGLINRLLGGLFGLVKNALILSVLLHFFQKLNASNAFAEKKTLDDSVFFYPVLEVSTAIFPVLEEWFSEPEKPQGEVPKVQQSV
jgi:membrane protein required for colicin V production